MPMAPSAAAKDSWPARKAEALGLFAQQHGAQVAVAQADLALDPRRSRGCRRPAGPSPMASAASAAVLHALLDARWPRPRYRPSTAFSNADGLDALDDLIRRRRPWHVQMPSASSRMLDAILGKDGVDLVDSSFVTFKQMPLFYPPSLILARVDVLGGRRRSGRRCRCSFRTLRWRPCPS